jgi:hypothetical protein
VTIIQYTRTLEEKLSKEIQRKSNGGELPIDLSPYKPNENDLMLMEEIKKFIEERKNKNGTN